jgi:NADPH2:quinone reductase
VVISSAGEPRVSFNLIDFYHNFSDGLALDSYGLTLEQVAQIEEGLRSGLDAGILKPPSIKIVPFDKAVDGYSRVANRQTKTKQVLRFD